MTTPNPHPLREQLAQLQYDVTVLRDWTRLLDESLHELGNSIDQLLLTEDPSLRAVAPPTIAQRIKNVRAAAGLSRQQLARIARVSTGTLRNIEAKRHRPSPRTMRRLLPAIIEMERTQAPLPDAAPRTDGAPHP